MWAGHREIPSSRVSAVTGAARNATVVRLRTRGVERVDDDCWDTVRRMHVDEARSESSDWRPGSKDRHQERGFEQADRAGEKTQRSPSQRVAGKSQTSEAARSQAGGMTWSTPATVPSSRAIAVG